MLLVFAAVIGFGGAFISLLMSKTMAKWSIGAQVIESPSNSTEVWLVDTVARLAETAQVADAGSGDLRGRAQRLRHRCEEEKFAGRRFHRPAAKHDREEAEACWPTRSRTSPMATW